MPCHLIGDAVPAVAKDFSAVGGAIMNVVAEVITQIDQYEAQKTATIAKLEAEGCRIVTGGETLDGGWEITDWRTQEIISSGQGDPDEYDREVERLDPDDRWQHIDNIEAELPYALRLDLIPDPLPFSLGNTLVDWIENNEDDARAMLASVQP